MEVLDSVDYLEEVALGLKLSNSDSVFDEF